MVKTPLRPVKSSSVWRGEDVQHDGSWVVQLTPEMVAEIDVRLAEAADTQLTVPFEPNQFQLNICGRVVEDVIGLLRNGPGMALIRGLPRDRYTTAQCELIYWAFGIHLGTPISQNTHGHRIGQVRDQGLTLADPNVRVYQTNAKLDYHADQLPVDVLGLFCLRSAQRGGESKIVSATEIHNVIRHERPDLLEVLYAPFNLDWRGEEPEGEQPWYQLPMFSWADGMIASRFTSLAYFRSVDRYGAELALTPDQAEALDLVQEIAHRPGMAVAMSFEEGDMQFLNNHVMLHAREAFEDHADPKLKRHLLRMWIAYPPVLRQPLSPLLADRYRYVEMGGIPAKPQRST
ncbi:TauD/TfdA family dioxygenase [uncultured Ilumatobacter sp.]|jgi:hypothetical protein|uniref:TauD/TfdA family dioxygenase n=1 Tax=uncultured Ilumatobacter sp. TaxID=879968 RepID=UPI00374FC2FF